MPVHFFDCVVIMTARRHIQRSKDLHDEEDL